MTSETKKSALVFLSLSLTLTVLIGMGLSRLELKPGMPFPSFENGQVVLSPVDAAPVGMPVNGISRILISVALAVLSAVLIVLIVKRTPLKRLLRELFSLFWKLLLATGTFLLALALLPKSQGTLQGEPPAPPKPLVTAPLGPVPTVLIWAVGICLLCTIMLLGARMLAARRHPVSRSWMREVERARQALLAGDDLRTVILQCYQRMGQELRQERQIEREAYMTTGEFEELLSAKGVPHAPVHRLTRLFEAVRYGCLKPAAEDVEEALQCLDAILEHGGQR